MSMVSKARILGAAAFVAGIFMAGSASAQQCGNNAGGFPAWKAAFKQTAASSGIKNRGLAALDGTTYATKTIQADRNQKSFKLTLEQFMARRGARQIAQRGKSLKKQHAQLFANIERKYGVPAGPLIAIWGLESGFGGFMGNQNIVSAVATLAYDCRRSEFFRGHLLAALQLVDRGNLSPNAIGAAHGEIGQTQFLPGSVVKYGVDGDGDGKIDLIRSRADALASTANFLKAHGWRAGAGYQEGQPNFGAIKGWNAAGVYQKTIAIVGREIDGD